MKHAQVSDLRKQLNHYLRLVHRGETVMVLNRSTPVAELHPVSPQRATDKFDTLEKKGILHRGTGRLPASFLKKSLHGKSAKVLRALIDEREKGR